MDKTDITQWCLHQADVFWTKILKEKQEEVTNEYTKANDCVVLCSKTKSDILNPYFASA